MKLEIIEDNSVVYEVICTGVMFKDGVFLVYTKDLVPHEWDIAITLKPGQVLVKGE